MKMCSICDVLKDLEEFWKKATSKDGLRTDCKDCARAREGRVAHYIAPEGHKRCGKCKVNKLFAKFSKNKSVKGGLHSHCKDCVRAGSGAIERDKDTSPSGYKTCSRCSFVKKITEFYKIKDRLRPYCKVCMYIENSHYQEMNSQSMKMYRKEYHRKNRDKRNASSAKRRATIINQTPKMTADEWDRIDKIYLECKLITEETGIEHHVDHIKPLSKGGLHHPDNLQVLTATANLKKHNKY